jgi:hypothetical protein
MAYTFNESTLVRIDPGSSAGKTAIRTFIGYKAVEVFRRHVRPRRDVQAMRPKQMITATHRAGSNWYHASRARVYFRCPESCWFRNAAGEIGRGKHSTTLRRERIGLSGFWKQMRGREEGQFRKARKQATLAIACFSPQLVLTCKRGIKRGEEYIRNILN